MHTLWIQKPKFGYCTGKFENDSMVNHTYDQEKKIDKNYNNPVYR